MLTKVNRVPAADELSTMDRVKSTAPRKNEIDALTACPIKVSSAGGAISFTDPVDLRPLKLKSDLLAGGSSCGMIQILIDNIHTIVWSKIFTDYKAALFVLLFDNIQ